MSSVRATILAVAAILVGGTMARIGGSLWGVWPGVLLGLASVLAVFLSAFIFIIGVFVAPNVAERYLNRRGLQVPKDLGVPGVFIPLGALRMVSRPDEYLAIMAACDGFLWPAHRLLLATASMPVTERGLVDIDFLRAAAWSGGTRSVIREAVTLASEYGGDRVVQYARHPSGVLRGFEMLRQGVPYEYAEMVA